MVYYVEDNLTKDTGVRHGPYATYFEAEAAAGKVRWDRTAGETLRLKGWKGDEPDFIREMLGKWSKTDARFVYPVHSCSPYDLLYAVERPVTPEKWRDGKQRVVVAKWQEHINPLTKKPAMWCDIEKAISDLPKRKKFNQKRQWMFAIGADFGYSPDPMAIVVWAFAHDTQDVYELFSWKATKVNTDDQGQYLLKAWCELDNVVVLVGDPAGKQDDFDVWRTRLQLPIDEANKQGKNTLEEFLADDIRLGRVHRCRRDGARCIACRASSRHPLAEGVDGTLEWPDNVGLISDGSRKVGPRARRLHDLLHRRTLRAQLLGLAPRLAVGPRGHRGEHAVAIRLDDLAELRRREPDRAPLPLDRGVRDRPHRLDDFAHLLAVVPAHHR
jgi:hypothetical protein